MGIPNLGRGGLPVYAPTGATLTIANGSQDATFTGTAFVATNTQTGAPEYAAGVGDTLVVSGVASALIESVVNATTVRLAHPWTGASQTSILAQDLPGWYVIRNSVPAFGSNAKAIQDLLAKGSDSSPDISRTIDNGASRLKLRINASGIPEFAAGASGAADDILIPALRIDPTSGEVTFPNTSIGTGGGGGGGGTAGTDSDPDVSETIESGGARGKFRVGSTGKVEIATGAAGAANSSLLPAIRVDPLTGQVSFPSGGSVAGMAGAGGSASFSGTGDPGLTRAQHMATNYASPPGRIWPTGWSTPGDWGGGLHIKTPGNVEPNHKGKFQTLDGTWYELFPEGGFVTPQMFGGLNTAVWNDRFPDAGPACNDAIDYMNFSRFGGCNLFMPGGFFIGTTVQMKGAFDLYGSSNAGTFVMVDYYTTGFMGHHNQWSFEVFGTLYFGGQDFLVGQTFYTAGGIPGTASAHTYICTAAGRTSSDGSQKPTGTGTGYVDGTATFDYYREATRVELLNRAWEGEFFRMKVYSHYDLSPKTGGSWLAQTNAPAVGPWPQKPSGLSAACGPWKPAFGFASRTRGHVHHCWMGGFPGIGCLFAANGDFDFPTMSGNVDYWCITHSQFYYNTMDGARNSYSNGNAGYMAHCDFAQNGRWGYRNQGFLGDAIVQIQSAFDGRASLAGNQRFPTSVAYAGYYYYALLGKIGAYNTPDYGAIAPTPGASNQAWGLLGGDGTWVSDNWNYPTWVSGNTYEAGGAFGSDNINARHSWWYAYIEGGTWPAQFNGRDVVIGGLLQGLFIGAGANLLSDGNWYNPIYYKSRSHNWSVGIGTGGTYGANGEGIYTFDDNGNEYSFRTDSYENDGATYATDTFCRAIGRFSYAWLIRAGQLQKFWGRTTQSALPAGAEGFRYLFFGSDGDLRQTDFRDSIPTGTGDPHGKGDFIFNRNASPGSVLGWRCNAAGDPGTLEVVPFPGGGGGGGTTGVTTNLQTASYTLAIGDAANVVVEMNSGSANNVTVPPNSSVAFPVGTLIEVCQVGAGTTTIVAGGGVTVHAPPAASLSSRGQWGTLGLRKRGTDEWVASGDFA